MGISTAHGVSNIEGWDSGSANEPRNSQMQSIGNVFVSAGGTHSGPYKLSVVMGGVAPGNYQQIPISFNNSGTAGTADKRVVVVRYYIYPTFVLVPAWMRFMGAGFNWNLPPGTETAYLEMDNAMHVRVNGGAPSVATLALGAWQKLEVLFDSVNSLQLVYLNDVLLCSNTAVISAMDWLYFGDFGGGGHNAVLNFDDCLVESDDSPLQVNIPFDQGNNLRMFQDGDSAAVNLWFASVGPAKYQDEDEVVPNDAVDYVFSNNGLSPPDQAQEFTLQSAAAAGIALGPNDSIKAVKLQSRHRRTLGSPGFVQRLRSGATLSSTLFQTPLATWESRCSRVYQFDPDDGLDWTIPDLDALEIGVQHTSGVAGTRVECTWQALTVDFGLQFTPSAFLPQINPEVVGPLTLLNVPEVGKEK